ncbi:hypothetical protein ACS0TY_012146 [Phlomoides rotata]
MASLMKVVEDLQAQVAAKDRTGGVLKVTRSPLSSDILRAPIQKKIQYPQLTLYDGEGDPRVHLSNYSDYMISTGATDATQC